MDDTKQSYRLDRSAIAVVNLDEEPGDAQFWLTRSSTERLAALEFMRQTLYGYNPTTTRLQRILTITQRPAG
ncbi:MAG: hypothetical protein MUD01_24315 [Chloroflexaceae bacterium]|nr:hypothetical protein [Chloroflexaceae bacterium]